MIVPDVTRDLSLVGVLPPAIKSPVLQPPVIGGYRGVPPPGFIGAGASPVGMQALIGGAGPPVQPATPGILATVAKYAPPVLAAIGATGLLSAILGGGGETGQEGAISQEGPAGYLAAMGQEFSMGRLPWSTPIGEGFIAPWTPNVAIGWEGQPSNVVYGQTGKDYPGYLEPHKLPSPPVKYWYANGIPFARLADGRIACERRDGVVKVWRPKKHIVISNNPRLSQLRKLDRVYKKVTKMVRRYAPKVKSARQLPSPYLSAVERKAIKA